MRSPRLAATALVALVAPAGSTYDMRWIDGMVQHHMGTLRMSELVFNIGVPGIGAPAKSIMHSRNA